MQTTDIRVTRPKGFDIFEEQQREAALDSGSAWHMSHQEFVSEVRRTGRVSLTIETLIAHQFAVSYCNSFFRYITRAMETLFTWRTVCLATVILAFTLHDARILLAIPAAFLGPPGLYGLLSYRLSDYHEASPEVRRDMFGLTRGSRIRTRLHQFLDLVALTGLCYAWFVFGWRSPWFLICAAYLVTFVECVIYHAVVRRVFFEMLVDDPGFYSAAIAAGVIRVPDSLANCGDTRIQRAIA
jgi:hypothetical protein